MQVTGTVYDTYYIYNNAGMVSYIIPPKAVSLLGGTLGYDLTTTPFSNMVFHYVYNVHGQPAQRTIPGKGVMYIVYDPLNRPVLMRDSDMGIKKQWNYIKYDAKGRAVSQGIYTDNNHLSLASMQNYVSGLSYGTYWYETRNSSATYMYYTNNVFPTGTVSGTSTSPLAYAYFDDYNMTGGGSPTFTYVAQHDVSLPNEESPTTAKVKGMPTVVTKTTVGSGLSGTWLTSVIFYDHNLHVIQQQSNNQLNYTGATTVTDFKTVVNDFTGMPLYSKATKKRTSADTVSVYTAISYDQVYRITGISQKYNSGPNNPVAAYYYNELGQPILKNLGYINPGSWLQNEDFRYNIRGWLMSINNSKLTPDGGKTNSDSNDVFGMQLMYDKADSSLTNTVRYNGRPTGSRWMTRNYSNTRTRERSFLYYYNGFGHYSGESYAERDSTSTGTSPYNINRGAFNETSLTYDLNGNLVTLSRNSSNAAGSFYQIDTLKYTYNSSNQNQLIKVTDGTDSVHTGHGFRSIDSTANYEYDANGNLYNDHFKGMQLRYNVLNRTDKINITTASGQSIDYTYDADGNLLRKRAYSGGTLQTTTDYVDGFVYITIGTGTPALSYFPMPEGRVVNVSGTLTQEFILTDQQGNARVAFRNVGGKAKVFQENSYYGTGLLLPNSPVSTPSIANKKLYNGGSEWQNDSPSGTYNLPDYYETFNRNYDATIGRFIGVDPMAESAEHLSSYQYAGCNPIVSNDPDGDIPMPNPPRGASGPDASNEFTYSTAELFWQAVDLNIQLGYTTFGQDFGVMGGGGLFDFSGGNDAASTSPSNESAPVSSGNNVVSGPNNLSSEIIIPGGGDIIIDDGSDAVYVQQPDGSLKFVKFDPCLIGDQIILSWAYQNNWLNQVNVTSTGAKGGNTPYYDAFNRVNSTVGATTILGLTGASVGYLKAGSASLKWYSSGWTGGSRAFIKTAQLSKFFEALGRAGIVIGFAADTYELATGNLEGGWQHWATITTMGIVGLTPLGFVTIPYFLIDAYYPGGFTAAMRDSAPLYNQMNQPNAAPPQVLMGMP